MMSLSSLFRASSRGSVASFSRKTSAGSWSRLARNAPCFSSATTRRFSVSSPPSQHDVEYTERQARIDTAAAYRLVAHFGWDDIIYNHISLRVPGPSPDKPAFLINPYGLMYEEVTASSLVKIDGDGNILDPGSATGKINYTGFVIHGAIHSFRKDLHCIIHTHYPPVVAVSSTEKGYLMLNQDAMVAGNVSYHDYEGISVSLDEQARLQQNLGTENSVMFMKNHGALMCGATVAEAFIRTYFIHKACDIQVLAASAGVSNPVSLPSPDIAAETMKVAAAFNKEGFGTLEFAALKRKLDRIDPSYAE